MTIQDKAAPRFFPEGLKELEKVHNLALKNWHNSIDQALHSITQIFHLSHNTLSNINRFQNDNLSIFLKGPAAKEKMQPVVAMDMDVDSSKHTLSGVAVVTGGTGGIGTAICRQLADENAVIVATYIESEKEQASAWRQERREEGLEVDLVECDVSDFKSCAKAARSVEKKYGHVDVLVNCAGITRDGMLRKLTQEDWRAVLDTNLDSVFNVTRNFVGGMIKKGYGRIINISSVNGQKGQFGQTNYSSSKAGIIGFSRSLAVELADKGITVNCVCPGYVGTSMVEAIPEHIRQGIISQIPAGRLATPGEIAHAVGFLASKEAAYVTGTELAVNGALLTG